jgi:hypothetical protein
MKAVTLSSSFELNGLHLPINTNAEKGQGCYLAILQRAGENLVGMLSFHSKVYVLQFGFCPYTYAANNLAMSRLMEKFKKRLVAKYKALRVAGGWVRETGASGVQHYHVVLMLDGHKVNKRGAVLALVKAMLEARGYPAPHFTKAHMVSRGDAISLAEAFYHLSYLAKIRTKGKRPSPTNDFSFARLKPKREAV